MIHWCRIREVVSEVSFVAGNTVLQPDLFDPKVTSTINPVPAFNEFKPRASQIPYKPVSIERRLKS